jgi:hypothetical protein
MAQKFLYFNSAIDGQTEADAYESSDFTATFTGSANEPVLTDASGYLNNFIDVSSIDHGGLSGLADDDHTQYILADGTRAFSGAQSMGSNKITNLADGTSTNDAVNLGQLQAIQNGMTWKDPVRVASTANITISSPGATIDGVTMATDDRVLLKDQSTASENGIYVWNGASSAMTRATDADEDAEVVANIVTAVEEGTAHADQVYILTTNNPITVGTTGQTWTILPVNTFTAGDGIDISAGNEISTDLLANGGLKIVSTELAIEPNDFAGEGLTDDGSDNLAIDWSTAFNDAKAVKAEDLNSTSSGEGASIIGIQDVGTYFTATNVEGALQELGASLVDRGVSYTADGTGVAKGDAVYVSANDTVSTYGTITSNLKVVGLAAAAATGSAVTVLANDTVVTGILTGATAGDVYYWNGSAHTTTAPTGVGSWVLQTGVAKNATDLHVEVKQVKKNT